VESGLLLDVCNVSFVFDILFFRVVHGSGIHSPLSASRSPTCPLIPDAIRSR
jgi:hypothetical protein